MSAVQNATQSMAEDAVMMIGYSVGNAYINDKLKEFFPDEVDEHGKPKVNYAREILSGGASMLFMSVMMTVIEREEKFLQYLFAGAEALIAVLWAKNKGTFEKIKGFVQSKKGIKATRGMKVMDSQTDVTNSFVGQVHQQVSNIVQARNASHDVANTVQASNSAQGVAVMKEAHDLRFANSNNRSFTDSLMIKMITGNFTQNDKILLQKIIGRNNFDKVPLDLDELNQVRDFMIVKDSAGRMIGLTESFVSLVNGLGFLKK